MKQNNRVIKFRVWDEDKNEFLKEFEIDIIENLNGTTESPISSSYQIEQFTGLKDKKGKEIYEGDIIWLNQSYQTFHAPVIFKYGCFGVVTNDYFRQLSWFNNDFVQVIGNIHENPELLNCPESIPNKGPKQCKNGHWLGSKEHPIK